MTHLRPILTACAVLLLLSACNKNLTAPPDDTSINPNLPKTYTEDITSAYYGNSVTSYNLTFDADNRLVSLVSQKSAGTKMEYNYSSGASYSLDIYNDNALTIHENFFLNGSSLVDSTFQFNDTQDTSTEKYFYNASKQLIRLNEYDYSRTTGGVLYNTHTYAYDSEGDQISDTDDNSIQTFTYYTDLTTKFTLGQSYFPESKHMLKTTTLTTGGQTETVTYTYTFDSHGRLNTEKDVTTTGDIILKTYTY